MDTGTRLLAVILIVTGLIIVDLAWYRGYYLDSLTRAVLRLVN